MRAVNITIIHNPTAGQGETARRQLTAALAAAGYTSAYQSTKDDDFPSALQDPGDVVLVAGGDGTVRRVALELYGRGVPMVLLPTGTANNIATTLGIGDDLDGCLTRLRRGQRGRLDMGRAGGILDDTAFFEGAGFGVVPELIRVMDRYAQEHTGDMNRGAELRHARRVLQRIVSLLPAFDCTIRAEGETRHMRLLLLEVMNVQRIGPSLPLAPDADAGDGEFDVVWVAESEREQLQESVRIWGDGGTAQSLAGRRIRTAALHVACDAAVAHIDDRVWRAKKKQRAGYEVDFSCEAGAVEVLL